MEGSMETALLSIWGPEKSCMREAGPAAWRTEMGITAILLKNTIMGNGRMKKRKGMGSFRSMGALTMDNGPGIMLWGGGIWNWQTERSLRAGLRITSLSKELSSTPTGTNIMERWKIILGIVRKVPISMRLWKLDIKVAISMTKKMEKVLFARFRDHFLWNWRWDEWNISRRSVEWEWSCKL